MRGGVFRNPPPGGFHFALSALASVRTVAVQKAIRMDDPSITGGAIDTHQPCPVLLMKYCRC
jgi:hypothetical protein